MNNSLSKFCLKGKIAVITGGAGLLGVKHAEIIAEAGGIPVLVDINKDRTENEASKIAKQFKTETLGIKANITDKEEVVKMTKEIVDKLGIPNILINNAANNPKMEAMNQAWSRFENFSLELWHNDLSVGLTGAFLCCQVIGQKMVENGSGVILNIASDLALIAPDQRIYQKEGLPKTQQPVKPVTYSVVKSALLGLTRYLATYWAEDNIRVNVLVPGGVFNNQPEDFINKLTNLIPMKRMANVDEYQAAVLFLISDASSYMTGSSLIIDGGRTCW